MNESNNGQHQSGPFRPINQEKIIMITRFSRIAFVFGAFAVAVAAAPISSFAAATTSSSNGIVVQQAMASVPSTGIYDGNDQYRDAKGFARSGWQYLALPPS